MKPTSPSTRNDLPAGRMFAAGVEEEARRLAVRGPCMAERQGVYAGFAIDAVGAAEIDDAVWVEPGATNGARLWVHIADPCAWIPAGSQVEQAILERCSTVYGPKGADPMMPGQLSSVAAGVASGSGGPKPALSVVMQVDDWGAVVTTEVLRTDLGPGALSLDYEQVEQLLLDPADPLYAPLRYLDTWAAKLAARRRRDGGLGGLNFGNLFLDEDGRLVTMPLRSQQIVAEVMIAANRAVAGWMRERGIVGFYRNQRWQEGQTWRPGEDMQELARLTHLLERAEYAVEAHGHASLRLEQYTHFTSPLRRAADLVTHRQVHAHLAGETAPFAVEELAELGRRFTEFAQVQSEATDSAGKVARLLRSERRAKTEGLIALSAEEFMRLFEANCTGVVDASAAPGLVRRQNRQAHPQPQQMALVEEASRRLEGEGLMGAETLDVLLAAAIEEAKLRVPLLGWLGRVPHLATQVLNRRVQSSGQSLHYLEPALNGPERFWARAVVDGRSTQEAGNGASRQGARHAACLLWCAALLEGRLVEESQVLPLSERTVQAVESSEALQPLRGNPTGELNTFCQRQGLGAPRFAEEAVVGGFEVTLRLHWQAEEFVGQGRGRSKAEAKHRASAALLTELG